MRTSPLLADFIHARACKPICEKYLTRPKEQEQIVKLQKMWALRKPILDAHILALQERIQQLEGEIDEIVMEKLYYNPTSILK